MNQEETMLSHQERYRETIKNLTVMSDILDRNVFKDKMSIRIIRKQPLPTAAIAVGSGCLL